MRDSLDPPFSVLVTECPWCLGENCRVEHSVTRGMVLSITVPTRHSGLLTTSNLSRITDTSVFALFHFHRHLKLVVAVRLDSSEKFGSV